jgi:hypothetical protein
MDSRPPGPRPATPLVLALALLGAFLAWGVPRALADPCVMDPMETLVGAVHVKGKRWVDGEEAKVKCVGRDGHTLDVSTCGSKTFQLVDTESCTIFADAPAGTLTFAGTENLVEKNTLVKARYVFSGIETGGTVTGALQGLLTGKGETPRDEFLKEKGTLTYAYENQFGQRVIFVGIYQAKYPQ